MALMNSHPMGSTHPTNGPSSSDGGGSRRAAIPPFKGAKEGSAGSKLPQSFRGVTWDKMKKMWRVRVCLAGGGREHVGYYLDEKEGALAYLRAVERIMTQDQSGSWSEQGGAYNGTPVGVSAARECGESPTR